MPATIISSYFIATDTIDTLFLILDIFYFFPNILPTVFYIVLLIVYLLTLIYFYASSVSWIWYSWAIALAPGSPSISTSKKFLIFPKLILKYD